MFRTTKSVIWGVAACVALFAIYATFRQRYIWGTDSFGYYQLGKHFSEGSIFLRTALPATEFPSLVPPGFTLREGGEVLPVYTPGLPLLLAIGHLVHMPMFVTPLLGAISVVLLYFLLRDRVPLETAIAFSAAWAFMPLTVYGSTMLMSDGVGATVLLAAVLSYRRSRLVIAGLLLGLAIAVRPTNVLFIVPFAFIVRFEPRLWRLAAGLAAMGLVYAIYNWRLYGAPWRTGYGDISAWLTLSAFPSHFGFYVDDLLRILSPIIPILALVGLFRPPAAGQDQIGWKVLCAGWPTILIIYYSLWAGGGIDGWWWARFLHPALPFVFLLAADGFERVRNGRMGSSMTPVLWVIVAGLPVYFIFFGIGQRDLWVRNTGVINFDVIQRVGSLAPDGSLVGTVELASTALLYSRLVPFDPGNENALALISKGFSEGRRVFLLVEPWNANGETVKKITDKYDHREIERYPRLWDGLPLVELTAARTR